MRKPGLTRSVASGLVLHCLVMSHKLEARFLWVDVSGYSFDVCMCRLFLVKPGCYTKMIVSSNDEAK